MTLNSQIRQEIRFLLKYLLRVPHVYILVIGTITLSISVIVIEAMGLLAIIPIMESLGSHPLDQNVKIFDPILQLMKSESGEVDIKTVAIFLFAIAVVKPALNFMTSIVNNVLPLRLRVVLLHHLVELQLHAALATTSREETGRWTSVYTTYIIQVAALAATFISSVPYLFLLVLYTVLMWLVSAKAVMLSIFVISFMWFMTRPLATIQTKLGRQITEATAIFNQSCLQMLSAMRLIRIAAGEKRIASDIFQKLRNFIHLHYRIIAVASLTGPFMTLTSGVLVAVLLYFGDVLFTGKQSDWLGALLLFIVVLYRMMAPAVALNGSRISIAQMWPALREVMRLMRICEQTQIKDGDLNFTDYGNDIEIRGLGFSYDYAPTLKNIDLKIPEGTMTAIVGPSGAGKSTLAALLLRLYDSSEGSILIGGVDIRDFQMATMRREIGFVSQDTMLLNDTLRNNFRFMQPGVTDDEIWAALARASAKDFVEELEDGLDTKLEENGQRLSGGERQRISLARALLSPKNILILDEATNQLDSFSEAAIQRTIESLRGTTTIIVIAHRLVTVQKADTIIVLNEGRIQERGSHRELLKAGNAYRRMIDQQRLILD